MKRSITGYKLMKGSYKAKEASKEKIAILKKEKKGVSEDGI